MSIVLQFRHTRKLCRTFAELQSEISEILHRDTAEATDLPCLEFSYKEGESYERYGPINHSGNFIVSPNPWGDCDKLLECSAATMRFLCSDLSALTEQHCHSECLGFVRETVGKVVLSAQGNKTEQAHLKCCFLDLRTNKQLADNPVSGIPTGMPCRLHSRSWPMPHLISHCIISALMPPMQR